MHKYARRAYDMGVRYIGGCCGFQPYHIRAIAEEVGLMNKPYMFNQLTTPPMVLLEPVETNEKIIQLVVSRPVAYLQAWTRR